MRLSGGENKSTSETTPTSLGFRGAWRRLVADGIGERELIRSVFRRNYVHGFAGSGLGYVWVVFMPCLHLFIYNLLQFMGVFTNPDSELPRSVTLTFGLILYFSFSETLSRVASGTVNNRQYIVQSGVPKMSLVISACMEVIADLAIRTIVYFIALTATIGIPSFSFLLLPLLAFPLMALGITLGLILNLFSVIYQDLTNVVRIAAFYLLFASGVFTAIPAEGFFFQILRASPVYQIIDTGRMMVLYGDFSALPQTLVAVVICIIFVPISIVAFYRAEKLLNSYL